MIVTRECDSPKGGVSSIRKDSLEKCEFKKYLPVFLSASIYQKIQESMQIQELSRISKVFIKPWIFLKVLESAWILGFSGKSLPVLAA